MRDKFYRTDTFDIDAQMIDNTRKKLITLNPQEKYRIPITENQRLRFFYTINSLIFNYIRKYYRYGWYYDVKLTNLDKNDKRLYFGKKMDHIIKLYLETMEKNSK